MRAFLHRTACFCVCSDRLMTVSRKFAGVFCDYYEFLQKNTLFPPLYIGENNQIQQTPLVFLHKMSLFARIKLLFAIDMVQGLLYN